MSDTKTPKHYGKIDPFTYCRANNITSFAVCNAIKYLTRMGKKIENLKDINGNDVTIKVSVEEDLQDAINCLQNELDYLMSLKGEEFNPF